MYTIDTITALDVAQVAHLVGPNKDSYSIESYFRKNVETEELNVSHHVFKNWYRGDRELLFSGSPKDCLEYIRGVVAKEGEWVRNDKFDYVFQPPVGSQV
jgi:hypothetical protein